MRITAEKAQENRKLIVEAAARTFRKRGYEGVGVADLMAEAGFSHGGFYNHFASKEALMIESTQCGFTQAPLGIEAFTLEDFVAFYLSRQHRDDPGQGCTVAALSGDAARQSDEIRQIFAKGIEGSIAGLTYMAQSQFAYDEKETRKTMVNTFANLIGALVLSRACPDGSDLAVEILETCSEHLREILKKAS